MVERHTRKSARQFSLRVRRAEKTTAPMARYLLPALAAYSALATAVAVILAVLARKTPYFKIDLTITRALQSIQAGWFDRLMNLVCGLGYPMQANTLGALTLVMLYRIGFQWEALTALFGTIGSLLITFIMLLFVNRPRPARDLVRVNNTLPTTSFPSGHTLIFTSIVGFLWYLAYRSRLPGPVRMPLLLILGAVVVLMGPARVYSGEHWASDVLPAYLMGSAWLAFLVRFYHWGKPRYHANHPEVLTGKWQS